MFYEKIWKPEKKIPKRVNLKTQKSEEKKWQKSRIFKIVIIQVRGNRRHVCVLDGLGLQLGLEVRYPYTAPPLISTLTINLNLSSTFMTCLVVVSDKSKFSMTTFGLASSMIAFIWMILTHNPRRESDTLVSLTESVIQYTYSLSGVQEETWPMPWE